jgi:glycosyltransferase involved in cell wall biosynthesis
MPCYNASDFVAEALQSVFDQTFQDIEVIAVDDGSTDDTLSRLDAFRDRITVVSQANQGVCSARNQGFLRSKGQYVIFLDADDYLSADTVETLLRAAQGFGGKDVVCCDWCRVEMVRGQRVVRGPLLRAGPAGDDHIAGWLAGWFVPPAGVLWPREVVSQLGGWDETLKVGEDGDIVVRALLGGVSFRFVGTTCVYYRKTPNSLSNSRSGEKLQSRLKVYLRAEAKLRETGRFEPYRLAMSRLYHNQARYHYTVDRNVAEECNGHALRLAGRNSYDGSRIHLCLTHLLGLRRKVCFEEWCKRLWLRVTPMLRRVKKSLFAWRQAVAARQGSLHRSRPVKK